jgi:hypothetical protein
MVKRLKLKARPTFSGHAQIQIEIFDFFDSIIYLVFYAFESFFYVFLFTLGFGPLLFEESLQKRRSNPLDRALV